MTVLTDGLLASFDDSVGPVDEARLLPPVLYTSPEFYNFEQRAVFQREWLCVGRADQLAEPGDYRCINIAGEPLIVCRDSDGELRVMTAVCRHRGMVIAEDSGNCRRFTCPYHHWTYGLDGALLGTPAMTAPSASTGQSTRCPSSRWRSGRGSSWPTSTTAPAPSAPP